MKTYVKKRLKTILMLTFFTIFAFLLCSESFAITAQQQMEKWEQEMSEGQQRAENQEKEWEQEMDQAHEDAVAQEQEWKDQMDTDTEQAKEIEEAMAEGEAWRGYSEMYDVDDDLTEAEQISTEEVQEETVAIGAEERHFAAETERGRATEKLHQFIDEAAPLPTGKGEEMPPSASTTVSQVPDGAVVYLPEQKKFLTDLETAALAMGGYEFQFVSTAGPRGKHIYEAVDPENPIRQMSAPLFGDNIGVASAEFTGRNFSSRDITGLTTGDEGEKDDPSCH